MFLIRLHVHGQPVPIEIPGWPTVHVARIVRDILSCSPLIAAAEVVEVDAPRDLFAGMGESEA
jgi:hypothetical protein